MRAISAAACLILGPLGLACGSDSPVGPSALPSASPAPSPAAECQTWIIFGQSNAIGYADGPLVTGSPRTSMWSDGAWVSPASEPLPFLMQYETATDTGHGWAVSLASHMAFPVRLTGFARGGTQIKWFLVHSDELLERLKYATDARWFIAYQGESDAIAGTQDTWAEFFAELMRRVRSRTNPALRVIVIGAADFNPNFRYDRGFRARWDQLHEQQQAYVASDRRAVYVSAEGLPLREDGFHLSGAGVDGLVERLHPIVR